MSHTRSWIAALPLLLISSSPAWANTGGIPALSTPIQLITGTIGGPILAALLTLALIVCGLGIAFAQNHGYDRLGNVFIGGSIAIGAPTIVLLIYGSLGAAAPVTPPPFASQAMLLCEDIAALSVQGWLTYLGWRGVRYVHRVTRGV